MLQFKELSLRCSFGLQVLIHLLQQFISLHLCKISLDWMLKVPLGCLFLPLDSMLHGNMWYFLNNKILQRYLVYLHTHHPSLAPCCYLLYTFKNTWLYSWNTLFIHSTPQEVTSTLNLVFIIPMQVFILLLHIYVCINTIMLHVFQHLNVIILYIPLPFIAQCYLIFIRSNT